MDELIDPAFLRDSEGNLLALMEEKRPG